jgi:hypothetical protein
MSRGRNDEMPECGTGAKRLIQRALTGPLVEISRFAPVPCTGNVAAAR